MSMFKDFAAGHVNIVDDKSKVHDERVAKLLDIIEQLQGKLVAISKVQEGRHAKVSEEVKKLQEENLCLKK